MTTYFIQMHSGHTQTVEGVKEVFKLEGDYVFYDENDKTITCVPAGNMAFYTVVKSETVQVTPIVIDGKTIVELINEADAQNAKINVRPINLNGAVTINTSESTVEDRKYKMTIIWDDGRFAVHDGVEHIQVYSHILESKDRTSQEEPNVMANTCFIKTITIVPLEKAM